jgi:hypothetical protein
MGKIIAIDSSGLFFPAVFNFERQVLKKIEDKSDVFILPPHYVYFNSLISCLKKIGVNDNTKVIIALEGKSWRKKYYAPYKAQRAGDREKHTIIDWEKEFENVNKVHTALEESTNFHLVREWSSECDDIISVACRYFKDDEVIVVSGDGDLKQLAYYPNVKFFSIYKKCKGSKGMFEHIENPLKILSDKARKGDVSDNIIPSPSDTAEDVELRYTLVNLLKLPDDIENKIVEIFENLPKKEMNLNRLNLFKNAKEKFLSIYNSANQITPEYCYKLNEKRKQRKQNEKNRKTSGNL